MAIVLEFFPEYNSGPLWSSTGASIELAALALPEDLVRRLGDWNASYDDSKLPFERNDSAWLEGGRRLLAEVRQALGPDYEVVVTEPWWREDPSPDPNP